MSRSNLLSVWVSVTFFLVLASCTRNTRFTNEIIHIEGVSRACNITTSYVWFGSASESEAKPEVFLPVSDGDLLYMVNEDGSNLYYRYNPDDGIHLVVSRDIMKPNLFFINGILSQFEVSSETIQRPNEELVALKPGRFPTLLFSDSLTGAMILELKKLQENSGGSGILIEHHISTGIFKELISICKPTWLVAESLPAGAGADRLILPKDLEFLWITGEPLLFTGDDLYQGNLESLVIAEWTPEQDEVIRLSALKKLHTLTLASCEISDLSPIRFPRSLQRMFLVGCEKLTDIGGIEAIPGLRSFGMAGSHDVSSLEPVMEFPELTRLAFPGNISQKDFASVIDRLPRLEVVELIDCPDIHDLSPLQQSGNLDILILRPDSVIPEHIGSLDQLELIVLSEEIFENSPESISGLRSQLPNTLIVPGSGLCLGSGWLLLILPVLIVARFLFKRK
ncbi:MAG: hypothetical protein V2B15_18725 [Bacteroidota bacterium]